jgi:hypothetical protein
VPPNKSLQQTGHAIDGSARHYANFRVNPQPNIPFQRVSFTFTAAEIAEFNSRRTA